MSGGKWEHRNRRLSEWADDIEDIIRKNNKTIPYESLGGSERRSWSIYHDDKGCTKENYEKEPLVYNTYSKETIENMRYGLLFTRLADIYLNRIDYLECDDDGEDSFNERLKEELSKLDIPNELKEVLCRV